MESLEQLNKEAKKQCKLMLDLLDTSNPHSDEYYLFDTVKWAFDMLLQYPNKTYWEHELDNLATHFSICNDNIQEKVCAQYLILCNCLSKIEEYYHTKKAKPITPDMIQNRAKAFKDAVNKAKQELNKFDAAHKAPKDNPL